MGISTMCYLYLILKKTIDMMAQVLDKNNISLPEGARKKDGGSILENKDRCHALVVGSSGSSSFNIDLDASMHMAVKFSYAYLRHQYFISYS